MNKKILLVFALICCYVVSAQQTAPKEDDGLVATDLDNGLVATDLDDNDLDNDDDLPSYATELDDLNDADGDEHELKPDDRRRRSSRRRSSRRRSSRRRSSRRRSYGGRRRRSSRSRSRRSRRSRSSRNNSRSQSSKSSKSGSSSHGGHGGFGHFGIEALGHATELTGHVLNHGHNGGSEHQYEGEGQHQEGVGQHYGGQGHQQGGYGQHQGGYGQQFGGYGQQHGGHGQQLGGYGQRHRGYIYGDGEEQNQHAESKDDEFDLNTVKSLDQTPDNGYEEDVVSDDVVEDLLDALTNPVDVV